MQQYPDEVWLWMKGYLNENGLADDIEPVPYSDHVIAHIFSGALCAIVAVHKSDWATAHRILDNMQSHYASVFLEGPGGYYSAFNSSTNLPFLDNDRYLGDNAWLLNALNHYQAAVYGTQFQDRYKTMADGIAAWIVSLQDAPSKQNRYNDYGLYSGYYGASNGSTPNQLMKIKIAEANTSALAALRGHTRWYAGAHGAVADQVEQFLFTASVGATGGLFNTADSRINPGKSDSGSFPSGSPSYDTYNYLDNTLWPLLTVQEPRNYNRLFTALPLVAADMFDTGVEPDVAPGAALSGWSDQKNKTRIFPEGYAYFRLMYERLAEMRKDQHKEFTAAEMPVGYDSLFSVIDQFLVDSSRVEGGKGMVIQSNDPGYAGESTAPSYEGSAWYMFGNLRVNPLSVSVTPRDIYYAVRPGSITLYDGSTRTLTAAELAALYGVDGEPYRVVNNDMDLPDDPEERMKYLVLVPRADNRYENIMYTAEDDGQDTAYRSDFDGTKRYIQETDHRALLEEDDGDILE
jgi:hypothetical protein